MASDTAPKDQAALLWNAPKVERQPPTPKPRILLFEFDRGPDHIRCELLEHGQLATEAQFSINGELLEARTFESSTLAALWADRRRKAIEQETTF